MVANQKPKPSSDAAPSLARMTDVRRGVERKVVVAVWWKNSLVTIRMPISITKSSPRNCPEV